MFDSLPFPLRVLMWPLRLVALIGLWLIGAGLALAAFIALLGGESVTALLLGILAGTCFELRRVLA